MKIIGQTKMIVGEMDSCFQIGAPNDYQYGTYYQEFVIKDIGEEFYSRIPILEVRIELNVQKGIVNVPKDVFCYQGSSSLPISITNDKSPFTSIQVSIEPDGTNSDSLLSTMTGFNTTTITQRKEPHLLYIQCKNKS